MKNFVLRDRNYPCVFLWSVGNEIEIKLTGPAVIKGVGNGNSQSFEPFQSNKVKLFYGKALVIIGSEKLEGKVVIEAKLKEMIVGKSEITIK